jgi:hypothetical protein
MADKPKLAPPYVSFTTFKNRVQGLASGGSIPKVIDASLFSTDSGGTQKQMIAAMRFFGLINEKGAPTDSLKAMASGDANKWQATLRAVMEEAYSTEQLDALLNGSPKSLRDSFAEYELQGSVLDKVVRFLIGAAEDAGEKVSSVHGRAGGSAQASGSAPAKRGRRIKARVRTVPRNESDGGAGGGEDTITFPIPLRGKIEGQLIVPRNLSSSDLPMVKAIVAAVEAFAKSQAEIEEITEELAEGGA